MNYEEKYKEAMKRADSLTEKYGGRDFAEYVFPELAESEDERTRRSLIDAIKIGYSNNGISFTKEAADRYIAWLEKQKDLAAIPDELVKNYKLFCKNGRREVAVLINAINGINEQKEQKPVERSREDNYIIGFVYALLNQIEWKDNWAMSKEECLRRLNNYIPQKPGTVWMAEQKEE